MKEEIGNKQLRSFGLLVGGIFGLIGIWPAIYHHRDPRWWAICLAGYLIVSALLFPRSLYWVHKGWMQVGHVMGAINTRIILGVAFFGLLTPIGVLRSRLLGKDPMGKSLRPDLTSYRVNSKTRSASHLTKQY